MKIFIKLNLFFFAFLSIAINGQNKELSLDSGTIDNQFEYVIQKSGKYKNNRVVKKDWLIKLKSNTLDSLGQLNSNIKLIENDLKEKNEKITSLETSLTQVKTKLEDTENEKSSMSLFGLMLDKLTYNLILWSIIVLLFVLSVFMFYKFKSSLSHTKSAKLKLAELEEEYENHRRNALEREQKVRRQLQDEIIKNKTSK